MGPLTALALWIEALALVGAGVALYGWPAEVGPSWPWALPPLAARFIGASFVGVGVGAALTARAGTPAVLVRNAVTGGGLLLAPLTGLLAPASEVAVPRLAAVGLALTALALTGMLAALEAGRRAGGSSAVPRALLVFLAIHLLAVTPVGVTMFVAPGSVAALWPWKLSVVNVRLVGSIFLASIPVSVLGLRSRHRSDLQPTLGVYAVFAALALVAVTVHFGLFDPHRVATWVFVAFYAFVALGSAGALLIGWERGQPAG